MTQAQAPAIERVIRHDRSIIAVGIATLCALSWVWIFLGAGMGMSALDMTRTGLFPHLDRSIPPMEMSAPLLTGQIGSFLLMTAMWWVMMIAMMLPSAAPMMLLHAGAVRHAQRKRRMAAGPVATATFLCGYLTVWLGFSVAAAALQFVLIGIGTLSGMMLWSASPWLSAALLALAALYQVTPVKRACLEHCRSPAHWLSRHWRPGAAGAFRMGLVHGSYCAGCCWALMLLLFVGGVMNLIWIAALAIIVLVEKLGFLRVQGGWFSATLLGVWAIATLLV